MDLTDDHFVRHFIGQAVAAQQKLDDVIATVNAHPQWSDQQVIRALADAGARYGPDRQESFAGTLDLRALEPFIGTVKSHSLAFIVRDKDQMEAGLNAADLLWHVQVYTVQASRECYYYLIYEPLDGTLIQLGLLKPLPH